MPLAFDRRLANVNPLILRQFTIGLKGVSNNPAGAFHTLCTLRFVVIECGGSTKILIQTDAWRHNLTILDMNQLSADQFVCHNAGRVS